MTKEAISKEPSGRTRRTPVSGRNVLTVVGKDPNFHYRIVNDDGDRVQAFKDAGYEIVEESSVRVGDKRINSASSEGSKAQVAVGQGKKAFVMRIRKEWFEEDQAKKQAYVKATEDSMRSKALDGTYGSLTLTKD